MNLVRQRDGGKNLDALAFDHHFINYEFYYIFFQPFCHYFRINCSINFKSDSSQPKQVSLSFSSLNAFAQAESISVYSLSTSTTSSMNPPTVPSESSTPPRHSLSSSRRSVSTNNFAVCWLTGNSETIFDKRLHPSEREL